MKLKKSSSVSVKIRLDNDFINLYMIIFDLHGAWTLISFILAMSLINSIFKKFCK